MPQIKAIRLVLTHTGVHRATCRTSLWGIVHRLIRPSAQQKSPKGLAEKRLKLLHSHDAHTRMKRARINAGTLRMQLVLRGRPWVFGVKI